VAGIVGLTVFGEPFTWRHGTGLLLSLVGVFLMLTR